MRLPNLALALVFSIMLTISAMPSLSFADEVPSEPVSQEPQPISEPAPTQEPQPAPIIEPSPQEPQPTPETPLIAPITEPVYQPPITSCPSEPSVPQCAVGDQPSPNYNNGCLVSYDCRSAGFIPDYNKYPVQPLTPVGGGTCSERITCPDGSSVSCNLDSTGTCGCAACPVSSNVLPQGCKQILDPGGFTKVVCDQVSRNSNCQEIPKEHLESKRLSCEQSGGNWNVGKGSDGCTFVECYNGGAVQSSYIQDTPFALTENVNCPSEEEIRKLKMEMFDTCRAVNQPLTFRVENGCKIPACGGGATSNQQGTAINQPQSQCSPLAESHRNPDVRKEAETNCALRTGGKPFKNFDSAGCAFIDCAIGDTSRQTDVSQYCPRDLPPDVYQKCAQDGGELIAKRDPNGCVAFSQCLRKSNRNDQKYINPIEEFPTQTEILEIAFKLEGLKIKLNELAKKALDVAQYWEKQNDPSAERFRLVAAKFNAAQDRVDEAKLRLRDSIGEGVSEDSLLDVRVMMKKVQNELNDAAYIMLSSDEDIDTKIEQGKGDECSEDEECFDEAWQYCTAGATSEPDGREGPIITLKGTEAVSEEDVRCVVHIEMTPDRLPPEAKQFLGIEGSVDMTCKFPLAIDFNEEGPSNEELKEYCTGTMLQLIEKFGGKNDQRGGPEVPGKCSGEECREYCPSSQEAAKECLEHLGPFLPPEARSGLEMIASGQGGFGGPGGFGSESPGGQFGGPSSYQGQEGGQYGGYESQYGGYDESGYQSYPGDYQGTYEYPQEQYPASPGGFETGSTGSETTEQSASTEQTAAGSASDEPIETIINENPA